MPMAETRNDALRACRVRTRLIVLEKMGQCRAVMRPNRAHALRVRLPLRPDPPRRAARRDASPHLRSGPAAAASTAAAAAKWGCPRGHPTLRQMLLAVSISPSSDACHGPVLA